jgi:hypothetical protein
MFSNGNQKVMNCVISGAQPANVRTETARRARHIGDKSETRHLSLGVAGTIAGLSAKREYRKRALFDDLIGDLLEAHRHLEAQGLRRLEVNHELILRRSLHGQIGGLLAF